VERTAQWVESGQSSEEAAKRFLQWLEPLLRRESYLALLLERPAVHERLLHLLGAARWPARYLQQHPGVIDELASDAMLRALCRSRLRARAGARWPPCNRRARTTTKPCSTCCAAPTMPRSSARWRAISKAASPSSRWPTTSARWPTACCASRPWCWSRLKSRHRDTPRFGIVGYGKLGGKELGYGSDLDIVFVFDDDDERARGLRGLVRKLINWLTVKTGEGDLFEIDTALRPNGNSGLLVTSFESYANYQQQRGSNTAWTWEHQAMTRARFVLGSRDFPRLQASLRPICTCISALMRCAKPSSPRRAMPLRCATRLKPCVSGCAAPTRYAAACSTSSTAPAAWWMWNLPCSTWCWPNPARTAS
jgi:glutamate-ammonia-ligase adenylyltransferase